MTAAVEAGSEREFAYTAGDFERVRRLIHQRAGIALCAGKRDLVYSRLSRRLRATGHRRFGDYLDALERGGDADEWQAFVNALTTNLTSFFREPHHFERLRALLTALPRGSRAALWCSAASTGEEAYSMAITAAETFGTLSPPVSIVATDIDTNVLATAARGVYPLERVAALPRAQLQRYFRRGVGANEGLCRVIDELRRLVSFRALNLLAPSWPLRGPLHAIFCRNVMIYFDKPTQRRLIERFVPLLADGGVLCLGHSESLPEAGQLLVSEGRTVYRRVFGAQP
ncbi:CheR family methyltransferase [Sinimarinibacterium thermocellulolyticum]|uniref:Chemotaxis protein methyltransferase n=1 Tax=Sinimarinibacterium thermocellulolyticum TaxID=3170016 RepID=A0ABV2ABF3_9GAMM